MAEGGWRRLPAYVLGAGLGVLLALVGAFFVPTRPVPWLSVGVLVGVAGNLVVPYQLGRAAGSPMGAIVPAVAWLATVVLLGTERREGDLVVTGSVPGLLFLVLGAVAAALAIPRVRPALAREARRRAAAEAGPDEVSGMTP